MLLMCFLLPDSMRLLDLTARELAEIVYSQTAEQRLRAWWILTVFHACVVYCVVGVFAVTAMAFTIVAAVADAVHARACNTPREMKHMRVAFVCFFLYACTLLVAFAYVSEMLAIGM
jgi:hypothetical protein